MTTLDPNVEIAKDAPLAVAHSTDDAKRVKKASDEHAKTVASEREQPVVGARAPGDHAGSKKAKKE
jgi:hypothetical protein